MNIDRFKDSGFKLRRVVWIFAIVTVTNFVYVPYAYVCKGRSGDSAKVVQAGYWLIHDPPTIPPTNDNPITAEKASELEDVSRHGDYERYCSVYIDKYKIFFQTLVILVLFGATYYTVNRSSVKTE